MTKEKVLPSFISLRHFCEYVYVCVHMFLFLCVCAGGWGWNVRERGSSLLQERELSGPATCQILIPHVTIPIK